MGGRVCEGEASGASERAERSTECDARPRRRWLAKVVRSRRDRRPPYLRPRSSRDALAKLSVALSGGGRCEAPSGCRLAGRGLAELCMPMVSCGRRRMACWWREGWTKRRPGVMMKLQQGECRNR